MLGPTPDARLGLRLTIECFARISTVRLLHRHSKMTSLFSIATADGAFVPAVPLALAVYRLGLYVDFCDSGCRWNVADEDT